MANQFFRPLVGWVIRYKAEIAQFGWPLVALESFNYCYDHFFFPASITIWGPILGGLIPVIIAFALNIVLFWAYDAMKIDWLRAKVVRDLADKENKTNLEKILTWHRTKRVTTWSKVKGVGGFIALTLAVDPVILAVYYRENYFKGVSLRDWGILLLATTSACFLWTTLWEFGMLAVRTVYHFIHVTFFM